MSELAHATGQWTLSKALGIKLKESKRRWPSRKKQDELGYSIFIQRNTGALRSKDDGSWYWNPKSGMARADCPHLKLVISYLMTGPFLIRACTCNSQGCGDELCTNEKIEAPWTDFLHQVVCPWVKLIMRHSCLGRAGEKLSFAA